MINSWKRKSYGDVVLDSLVVKGVGRFIVRFFILELIINGDEEMVYRVLREICVLIKIGSFNRFCLVEVGCVSLFINFLVLEDLRI